MANEADFGEKCGAWLMKFDPVSSSWKTAQQSLFEDLSESLPTLPRWGSMRNGVVSERKMLALPTAEKDFGWSQLMPTPVSMERTRTSVSDRTARLCEEKKHQHTMWTYVAFRCKCGSKTHRLEPRFAEWSMGWPVGHTDLAPLATDSFQQWQRLHGGF